MSDPSTAIVLRPPDPEPAPEPAKEPAPTRPPGVKVTVESADGTMVLDLIEGDSKLRVVATFKSEGVDETRELPDNVVRSVKHTVERLLVVAHTAREPLCSGCGHAKSLHVPGHECAGDFYSNGKMCHCEGFKP